MGSKAKPYIRRRRGSGGDSRERTTLAVLQKSEGELPPADAKPEYHNVVATVTSIDADQTPLYYDAAPDTGRKASPRLLSVPRVLVAHSARYGLGIHWA